MSKKQDILNSDTRRTQGIDAHKSNIEAAKAVAQIVKTTLGPMGMDKMLIDSFGNTIITNDGAKILKEMQVEHPAAKMLVEVAKTQEAEIGDGTTSAVILSGELLERAQILLKKKIHPNNIVLNYKLASKKALDFLNLNSKKIDIEDEIVMKNICKTAITGKASELSVDELSTLIYNSVKQVKDEKGIGKNKIKIIKVVGGNIEDSQMIDGIVLDKELSNPNMPTKIENSKVLLIDFPLEVRELDSAAKVNLGSLSEYEEFIESEKAYLKSIVYKIKEIGATTVVCQKGIDDSVAYFLAKENILALRRCRRSDLEKLSFALDSKIVSSFDDLSVDNLSIAKNVERKEILNEYYIFIEGCTNPKAITIVLKSSTIHMLDEIERAVEDAFGDLNSLIKSGKIVAGGGAIDVELYKTLMEYSKEFKDDKRLIIETFAKSFLSIPNTLLENCGFDVSEKINELILNHEKGIKFSGIDGGVGIVENTIDCGIIEPINVKIQAIKSATEISSMILRIDDIIASKPIEDSADNFQI